MKQTWTIGRRVAASCAALTLLALLLGGMAYYISADARRHIREIGENRLPAVQQILSIAESAQKIKAAQRTLLIPELETADRRRQLAHLDEARAAYATARDALLARHDLADEQTSAWSEFASAWDRWSTDNDAFLKLNAELEALAILNPPALQRDLRRFIGDHHKLQLDMLALVETGVAHAGGDDPSACNFGRWLATFDTTNPELKALLGEILPHHQAFHANVKRAKSLAATDRSAAARIVREDMGRAAEATFQTFHRLLAHADHAAELRARMTEQLTRVCLASQNQAEASLARLVEIERASAADVVRDTVVRSALLQKASVAAVCLGLALAAVLCLLTTRTINRVLRAVADDIGLGSGQIAAAAGEVSASSQALADGASRQAASLEETGASIEELASMTKRNSGHAAQAKELASRARSAAETGGEQMRAMSEAMQSIKAGSDNITQIIKTIDEIAFQTNILALNAAVEAARAGASGAGFAVVADEVRALAQRSAQAAKETAGLIETSVRWTTQGVELSARVADSLAGIRDQVRQVDELVAEVATASAEQRQGLDQINTAVSQVDKVTQANASASEECAAAAEELNAQSQTLKSGVSVLLSLVGSRAR